MMHPASQLQGRLRLVQLLVLVPSCTPAGNKQLAGLSRLSPSAALYVLDRSICCAQEAAGGLTSCSWYEPTIAPPVASQMCTQPSALPQVTSSSLGEQATCIFAGVPAEHSSCRSCPEATECSSTAPLTLHGSACVSGEHQQ